MSHSVRAAGAAQGRSVMALRGSRSASVALRPGRVVAGPALVAGMMGDGQVVCPIVE